MKPQKAIVRSQALAEMIALDQIEPVSIGQPRTVFNEAKLQELADSIKQRGVIEPIILRPRVSAFGVMQNTKGKPQVVLLSNEADNLVTWTGPVCKTPAEAEKIVADKNAALSPYELVAGERRWRAAKIADLKEIPSMVRSLDNKAVLEMQLIENLQREDLSPLEEARHFKRLIAEHNHTAESLAAKLGKSRSHVYGMLKLCELPPIAAEALSKGVISKSHAELIAGVPNEKMRDLFARDILDELEEDETLEDFEKNEWAEVMSLRSAKRHRESTFMVQLKGASFSKTDATLVPAAGACTVCPKMTGNDRDLFPDGRADMCTDPECFSAKKTANAERIASLAQGQGLKVLGAKESAALFPYGERLKHGSAYVDLAENCVDDKKHRSFKQLLGDKVKPVIAFDREGKPHRIVRKEDAAPVLKEKGIVDRNVSPNRAHDTYAEQEKRRRLNERIRLLAIEKALKLLAKKKWEKVDLVFLVPALAGAPRDLRQLFEVRGVKHVYDADITRLSAGIKTDEEAITLAMQVIVGSGLGQWARGYSHSLSAKKNSEKVLKLAKITLPSLVLQAKRELAKPKKVPVSKKKTESPKVDLHQADCVRFLTAIPVGDPNFKKHLEHASIEALKVAVRVKTVTKTNKARLESRLRALQKESTK
jgi:ParB/RepB/Spo0J family partition protein